MKMQGQELNSFDVHTFVTTLLGNTQHNKRLESIANAALGIISSASLIAAWKSNPFIVENIF